MLRTGTVEALCVSVVGSIQESNHLCRALYDYGV